jgi:O-succinylbenzoate synthase
MDALIYRYKLENREGLLVELINEEGGRGMGEIAPLPGWSHETLSGVLEELRAGNIISPSVQFGLESAYLSLSPVQLPLSFPICPLLTGSAAEILRKASSLTEKIVKVKLAALNDEEAFDILKELRKRFHLRIDLNRQWTSQRSLKFFSASLGRF